MISLVLGYMSSGKSIFAENLLKLKKEPALYIGTLPDNSYYKETIEEHKKRRPDDWGLIELIHDPGCDMDMLDNKIASYNNFIFDGLTFYILRQLTMYGKDVDFYKNAFIDLLEKMQNKDKAIFIVDTPVPSNLSENFKKAILYSHYLIIERANEIYYVNNAAVSKMTALEAFIFDRKQMYKENTNIL